MTENKVPDSIVVMGVSGSGKSTVGRALAQLIGYAFIDADDLHPESNKKIMAAGIPLTDDERVPWLRIIGEALEAHQESGRPLILGCSALKRSYRDLLRQYSSQLYFVFLDGTKDEILTRISKRDHEFMPTSLLDSQFSNLEPLEEDEYGIRIRVTEPVETLVVNIAQSLRKSN